MNIQNTFGDYSSSTVIDIQCTGTEDSLANCTLTINHNCNQKVALACYPPATYNGQPILVPGPSAGRLLVHTGLSWGTVSKDSFGVEDARVVCRELGQPIGSMCHII